MNKKRYFAAGVVFLCLAFLMLELAGNVHLLLSAGTGSVTLHPLLLIRLLLSSRKALMMYLLLLGFAALFVWWGLFGRSYLNYHSKMFEVVPGYDRQQKAELATISVLRLFRSASQSNGQLRAQRALQAEKFRNLSETAKKDLRRKQQQAGNWSLEM